MEFYVFERKNWVKQPIFFIFNNKNYVEPLVGVTCTRNIEMIYNGTMVKINRDDDFASLSLPNDCLSWEVGVFRSDLKLKRPIFQQTKFISLFQNRNKFYPM